MGEKMAETFQPHDQRREGELDVWLVRQGERDRFWHGWASLTLYEQIDATDEIREACVKVLGPVPPRR